MTSGLWWWWIPFTKSLFRYIPNRLIRLLDPMQLNVFEVVSSPCTCDRMTLPHLAIRTNCRFSGVEKRTNRMNNKLKTLSSNLSIIDLLFVHSSCFSISLKVIFPRNRKNGTKGTCKIWRRSFNRRDDISETHMYWPFLLFARIVHKMCLLWTAKWRDNCSSKQPPQCLIQSKS